MPDDVRRLQAPAPPSPNGAAPPPKLDLLPALESGLGRAAVLAGAIAGTVGLLYVIGGAVMWLRFDKVGLPADQAVAMMSRTDLLVVGLRVMVLPALAGGALLLALVSLWVARQGRIERLRAAKREKERELSGRFARADRGDEPTTEEMRDEVAELQTKLDRAQPPTSLRKALPGPKENPLRFGLLIAVVLAVALVVPFSPGALAWPLGLAAVVGYWLHLRAVSVRSPGTPFPVWRVAAAVVLVAAVISIARQTDPPVELPVVQAGITNPSPVLETMFADAFQATGTGAKPSGNVTGVLIAMNDHEVDVGALTTGSIATIPRTTISSVAITSALDQSAPPQSIASRYLFGKSVWAITPLEFWCGNERYGWARILDACQGRPYAAPQDSDARANRNQLVGLRVTCPTAADRACHGFLQVTTKKAFLSPQMHAMLPVSTPPQAFSIAGGTSGAVRVPIDQAGLARLLGTDHPVPVAIRLSLDRYGRAVVFRGDGKIRVRPPAQRAPSPKPVVHPRTPTPAAGAPTRPRHGAGGGGGDHAGARPSPTAAPSPTATPTVAAQVTATPDASSPVQPQEQDQQIPSAPATPQVDG